MFRRRPEELRGPPGEGEEETESLLAKEQGEDAKTRYSKVQAPPPRCTWCEDPEIGCHRVPGAHWRWPLFWPP
eukprot:symbB.v1.2.039946.t1/scaffold6892.1/size16874/1